MSIKFIGVKGKNRLRLKPRTAESELIVDSLAHTPTIKGTPIEIFDGSYGICLGQSEVSCDGAYDSLGIEGNLDYNTGWTLFLNGQEYGRYTAMDPIEYSSDWNFDYKITVSFFGPDNTLWIQNRSGGDLRVTLKPDVKLANTPMKFVDSDIFFPTRPSENVLVGDDGSINVCLRFNPGPSGPMAS